MGLTRLAIARPVVILMMVAAFLVLGLVGYSRLPAELNPKVDFPRVTVRTTYAGTNPQEMETLITKPIEDAISGVSGIQQITSHSEQGTSTVSIQFYFGTDLNTATADVIQKVDAIRKLLPTDADSPAVLKADTSGQPVMHIAMQSKTRPQRELQSLATNVVQPALEQATDVGSVNVAQGAQREIRVSVPAAAWPPTASRSRSSRRPSRPPTSTARAASSRAATSTTTSGCSASSPAWTRSATCG